MSRLTRLLSFVAGHRPRVADDPSLIQAAVALVFAPDPDQLLLIRRAERDDDPWSGHMALPGGRRDAGDPDLRATAIRETREEVGIDLEDARLVGRLDDLAPSTPVLPPIMVRPFVFRLQRRADLLPSLEVAEAAWVGLDAFLAPGVYGLLDVKTGGTWIRRLGYRLPQGVVWGMTERILTPALRAVALVSPEGVDD